MGAHRRTIVLADLHLTRDSADPRLTDDFVRLIEQHPGARIIVAGDFFDITTDSPHTPRQLGVRRLFQAHPALGSSLAEHLDRGGTLDFIGGNHDADMGSDGLRPLLLEIINPTAEARGRLRTRPWFLREGGLHIEHGHLYDPDNAPAHPLIIGERSLGVTFSAEFINRTGAHRYLLVNDWTPLKLLLGAFQWYGRRGPYVVYRYFHTALSVLARSGPFYHGAEERCRGRDMHPSYAEQSGVAVDQLERLLELCAPSTLQSLPATFARLYMDRVIAFLLLTGGLGAVASGRFPLAAKLGSLGAVLMTISWLLGHNRYSEAVVDRLQAAADQVSEHTGAELVVFAHAHREALREGYANTGAFAFPRDAPGRPYLEIEGSPSHPRAVRRYLPREG